ncbi:molybdopterin-dependent oxidoreductase [Sporomusa sp.]|uniref:molybdopterin-dependent oxidoreductase n=1 Tax=Sporomusa sp. TaxID=2078658 RepID=UPI002D025289|nr:molybdopterin-dependent oxidoreductase [Sporomusa sp.]HWR08023.1 molybdopterin-dependent oxidoreductase [Sporomusa sp.]
MTLIDRAQNYPISRRDFLRLSGTAIAGAVTAMMLPGYGLMRPGPAYANSLTMEGRWVTAACWHNCGGRCLNKAYVVDGVVLRQKTDDTHPDSPDFPQQRGCLRGRSQREQVLGADRLKYPMKRKNWQPGGGRKELRGQDEWVRISWDEALDIVAGEIKRIKETHGNSAVFIPSGSELPRVLSLYGGYTERWGLVSWGSWPDVYPFITGVKSNGATDGNDRFRLRKSRLIILWGANPAVSSNGNPAYNYLQAKKAGTRFIIVDPLYTDTARVLADQWIPCRPGTDTALILGMAYHIITNNLHDQEFLNKYCIGFDSGHMPPGVDPQENFKDYLLGTYDGIPKTPEWAAQTCGVEPAVIRAFAVEYAGTKPTAIITGGGPARINNGEHVPHAMLTLGFLTGNFGIPGAGVSPNMHNRATYPGPVLVKPGPKGIPAIANPLAKTRLNNGEMWDAVLTGKYTAGEGPKKDINVQMIYHGFGSDLNQRAGSLRGVEAHRKVEFVVTQNYVFNTNAKYSDVVLPVITQWEAEGGVITGNREILINYTQVIEPLYEAKSDLWIATEIGKRLGLDTAKIDPVPASQAVFNQIAGAQVMKPDGSGYEKLVTITAQDIAGLAVQGTPQTGRITYQEFREKGIYQVPRSTGDKLEFTSFEEFVADPVNNKLKTVTGKFQIYSQELSAHIKSFGWSTKAALPKYEPALEGYEDGIRDGYPFQLVTIHYQRRAHSTFDNVPWLREAFPQEFWLNAADARKLGIATGHIVKITSRHGAVIRPAYVTERIMPGVVALGQGAWLEVDEKTGIDKAGTTNVLNGPIPTGQGHSGYNSCNVQVEKYDQPLAPDYKWPQRVIL